MRNDFTSQVETREIDDADLDNVSGGVLGLHAAQTVGTVEGVLPLGLSQVTGNVTGTALGTVDGLVSGSVQGIAGI